MLGWKSRDTAQGRVGVAIDADGFALVHVDGAGERPTLEVCEYVPFAGEEEFVLALTGAVREHGLAGLSTTAVLPADAYVLRPIDRPDVPEDELKEATRWALRDQLAFDPAEAVVDCMPIPAANQEATRQIYAVAARGDRIDHTVGLLRSSGLRPRALEVRETALLNLAPRVGAPDQAQAFLRLSPKRSRFGVTREGELCMTRDLVTDLSILEADTDEIGPEIENVLLEVQRSLDYFESNFGRVPAQTLWVLPSPFELGAFVHYLGENLTVPVTPLDLSALVDTTVPLPQALQDQTLAAFSAALRPPSVRHLAMWNPQVEVPRERLSGDALVKATVALAAGLAAVSAFGSWQNGRTATTVEQVEAQLAAETARVEVLEQRAGRGPDAGLADRIASLRAARAQKTRVLAALAGGDLGNLEGFSAALETLGRRDSSDVWLDRIRLRDGGRNVELAGGALRPEAVPDWLAGLGEEPAFAGKSFRAFELGPPAAGAASVTFSIASERAEGDAS